MSAYIYAIIPYRSGISFDGDDPITCIYGPVLSELDEMDDPSFSFDEWAQSLKDKKGQSVVELNTEILSGNACYSYYYDDFSDIIMERPGR